MHMQDTLLNLTNINADLRRQQEWLCIRVNRHKTSIRKALKKFFQHFPDRLVTVGILLNNFIILGNESFEPVISCRNGSP